MKAAEDAPSAAATLQEEECKSLLDAAYALVAEAQAAAYVVQEKLGGQDVKFVQVGGAGSINGALFAYV